MKGLIIGEKKEKFETFWNLNDRVNWKATTPPLGIESSFSGRKEERRGAGSTKENRIPCFIVVGGIEKRRWTRCKRSHQLGGKRLHSILFTSKRPHCGTTITTDRIPLPRGAFNLVTRNVAFYGQLFLPWPLVAFCENRPTVRSLKAGKSGARCAPSIIYLPFPQIFVNTRCPWMDNIGILLEDWKIYQSYFNSIRERRMFLCHWHLIVENNFRKGIENFEK